MGLVGYLYGAVVKTVTWKQEEKDFCRVARRKHSSIFSPVKLLSEYTLAFRRDKNWPRWKQRILVYIIIQRYISVLYYYICNDNNVKYIFRVLSKFTCFIPFILAHARTHLYMKYWFRSTHVRPLLKISHLTISFFSEIKNRLVTRRQTGIRKLSGDGRFENNQNRFIYI